MNSEISSAARTLEAKSSAPSSVSFEYRKWGIRLQKSEKLNDKSGRINPKIVPNLVCW